MATSEFPASPPASARTPESAPVPPHPRWQLSLSLPFPILLLLTAIWLGIAANLAFWHSVFRLHAFETPREFMAVAALLPIVVALFNLLLQLSIPRPGGKALLTVLLLISAVLAYFMISYGAMIDKGMLRNALETDPSEVRALLSPKLLLIVFMLGALPAALLACIGTRRSAWWKEIGLRLSLALASLLIILGLGLTFYQDYSAFFRNHRAIAFQLNPVNLLRAGISLLHEKIARPRTFLVLGDDAHRVIEAGTHERPELTIIVVGETARADNFSLGGYARITNPLLEQAGAIYYPNVTSCGTATAISVPCMFSSLRHRNFSAEAAAAQSNLLDVLQTAGIAVRWRDNNSGCKGVCTRVPSEDVTKPGTPGLCKSHECFDEILLNGLQGFLDHLDHDAVLVLHQEGSHGPAYYQRYPPEFARFGPACQTNQLEQCSPEEIRAAYDNTILYTDHVLARLIDLLKRNAARVDGAMIYMSDHGESLGENHLYLHGLPYMLAPRQQKHVPMVVWLSDEMMQRHGIDASCLREQRQAAYSHDNLFHSVLGLMDVRTGLYVPALDLFAHCRTQPLADMAHARKMPG